MFHSGRSLVLLPIYFYADRAFCICFSADYPVLSASAEDTAADSGQEEIPGSRDDSAVDSAADGNPVGSHHTGRQTA